MNKSTHKSKVAELLELFSQSPELAFRNLISSGIYFKNPKSTDFWLGYSLLDVVKLCNTFPDSITLFNKMEWLKRFYELNEFYSMEKLVKVNEVIALNPSAKDFITALYLCLELGTTSENYSEFPPYADESLSAVKSIFRDIQPRLTTSHPYSYSPELVYLSNTLIKIQMNTDLLVELVDAFVWADLVIKNEEGQHEYFLTIPDGQDKSENRYVQNDIKSAIKRAYKSSESQLKISNEEHFKNVDLTLKTNEGIAGAFEISGAKLKSTTPGITVLNAEHLDISGLSSTNPGDYSKAVANIQVLQLEQLFHYQYRHALAQVYQPNDEIDIHAIHIKLEDEIYVTLYEIICAMACLIAKSYVYQYLSNIPGSGSINSIKRILLAQYKEIHPEFVLKELHDLSNLQIVEQYPEIPKHTDNISLPFVTNEGLLKLLQEIKELQNHKNLQAIIDLFSSNEFPLPSNPIYKINDGYFFSLQSCDFNLNRKLYDYYISEKLFSQKGKIGIEKSLASQRSNSRTEKFSKSVAELLLKLSPFVAPDVKFGGKSNANEFGELEGDIDTIVYFETENILMPIQIKLSNVSRNSEVSKSIWVTDKLVKDGVLQVYKDLTLLRSSRGLDFIANKLCYPNQIKNPLLYPLFVTDNFFADHEEFIYNESGDKVRCISYFELKHLILNKPIHEQQKLPELKGESIASQLIKAIENNLFWKFIADEAANYSYTKSLTAIKDEFKITLKI